MYVGAAFPEAPVAHLSAGVAHETVSVCEANAARYWPNRVALNNAVLLAGGATVDWQVFSAAERDAMPFYREVIAPIGVRSVACAVFGVRAQKNVCLYLGRATAGAFTRSLERLREAIPVLALGVALHGRKRPAPAVAEDRFSRREREICDYVCLGLSNAEIAMAMGTSPNTVKNQIASLLRKAEVANRTELASVLLSDASLS